MVDVATVTAAVNEAGSITTGVDLPKDWADRLRQVSCQKTPPGEQPVARVAAVLAGKVLWMLASRFVTRPGIFAMPSGGIQLRWEGTSLEVHIGNDSIINIRHFEETLVDLDEVRAAIAEVEQATAGNEVQVDDLYATRMPPEWRGRLTDLCMEESPAADATAPQALWYTQLLLHAFAGRQVPQPTMKLMLAGGVDLEWPDATVQVRNGGRLILVVGDTNLPDQPDGIEDGSTGMPAPAKAATRVLSYVGEFGDGLYDSLNGNPLYGRDLEALAKTALAVQGLLDDLTRAFPEPTQFSTEANVIQQLTGILAKRAG